MSIGTARSANFTARRPREARSARRHWPQEPGRGTCQECICAQTRFVSATGVRRAYVSLRSAARSGDRVDKGSVLERNGVSQPVVSP
jgi:hypothetical protein